MEGTERKRTGGGRPGRGVTLADLARALRVSKATVSNAYNRPDQLSARLRERILAEAGRLGYPGPDPIAATFSRRRAGAIGLVFDDPLTFALSDPAEALFVNGIGEVCERFDVGLVLIPRGTETDLVQRALVDGFVCHCDLDGDGRIDTALGRDVPVVVVDGPARPPAGHVGIDDRAAAATAARHLIALGHRRIAVLASPLHPDGRTGRAELARQQTARLHVMRERLAGYRAELTAGGITWADVPVVECAPYGREAGYRATNDLLGAPDRPTALLAASDEIALGALRAAAEHGIAVPERLSVVGFDDAPPAAWSSPGLTTVHQPHRDKGRAAAEQLLGLPATRAEALLPTALVVRGTTAPPPGTAGG
ncbi:LacI family DNA-binding transcriptional regulator [Plantactinospora mayteni]|uniref:Transcriptional regulator n=1 Tax=Plantactinospora mayteni TaxID=566021 RepID=A0ABQ4F1W3_9ACTN|nr:LacI family DNA-binding transcriptional regulator [Plantactinospora mayteni]GIH00911.1 transcriptional regulator [Plantactinospora mayteni]